MPTNRSKLLSQKQRDLLTRAISGEDRQIPETVHYKPSGHVDFVMPERRWYVPAGYLVVHGGSAEYSAARALTARGLLKREYVPQPHRKTSDEPGTTLMGAGSQRWWRTPAVLEAEGRAWLASENVRVLYAITDGVKPPIATVRAWLDALRVLVDFVVHGRAPAQVWIPKDAKFSDAQAQLILERGRWRQRKRPCPKSPRGQA